MNVSVVCLSVTIQCSTEMAEWTELLISTHARTLHNPALAIWTTAKLGPVLSVPHPTLNRLSSFFCDVTTTASDVN